MDKMYNNIEKLRKYKSFSEYNKAKKEEFLNNYKKVEEKFNVKYFSEPAPIKEIHKDLSYNDKSQEVYKIFTYEMPNYDSAPVNAAPVQGVVVPDIFADYDNSDDKDRELDRLFNMNGLVYRFNRGIVMINQEGRKVEDIFDGTNKHHAMRLHEIARDEFGVDVPFLGGVEDIAEAMDAASKGLTTLLYEGNFCQLYLPEDLSVDILTQIIEEVEPRGDFLFFIIKDGKFAENLLQSETLEYLNALLELERQKESQEEIIKEVVENTNLDKDEYIRRLIEYTNAIGMSIYDYYRMIAIYYRHNDIDLIPDFEKQNPFINENDINMLVQDTDDRMPIFFANSMNRVIELNLNNGVGTNTNNNNDTNTNTNTNNNTNNNNGNNNPPSNNNNNNNNGNSNPPSNNNNNNNNGNSNPPTNNDLNDMFTNNEDKPINLDVLDNMNGFAVIREEVANKVNIYGYNNDDKDNLRGRKVVPADKYSIKSGYYVNYKDYIESIISQYAGDEIVFVDENNQEIDLRTTVQNALAFVKQSGRITFGNEDDKDLRYNGIPLSGGVYVNRDYLFAYFSKLKVRVKSNDNTQTNHIVR